MLRAGLCLLLLAGLAAGADEVWVAVTMTAEKDDDAPEYFGRISPAELASLSDGTFKPAFFPLAGVCWSGDDDRIEDLADDRFAGDLLLRVADLRRIAPLKGDPHTPPGKPAKPRGPEAEKPGLGAAQPKL
jgi:hypothetical protein